MGDGWRSGRIVLAALAVAASACSSVRAHPFEKPVKVDGDALEVTVVVNPCTTVESVNVEEEADQVRLTAMIREDDGGCVDMGVSVTRRVLLQAPVGDRAIVDGACSIEKYRTYSSCQAR